ncbi:MFS transporter, partial [Escherichia coli]|uniref:MFS transporter n=1 Tax=Escherichia coli TaxID=562 RepID=UPI000AE08661
MNKIKNYRWHMIALVCFITVINYLDRTALGIAAPTIMETTGITKEQYSWIVSAFQLAYTLGQPIMGFFIDTVGLKLIKLTPRSWKNFATKPLAKQPRSPS